jgi:hypothetical protein
LRLQDYAGDHEELASLVRLAGAGFAVAPTRIVSPADEERFYRLNNLPQRLSDLFSVVDYRDPDEDDVEDLIPHAQALLKTHYLLDEFIDLFYLSLEDMPGRLLLRRPSRREGLEASKGRPTLLALKTLWAMEWTLESVMARLKSGSIALQAQPVLIQPASSQAAPESLSDRASELLGKKVTLLKSTDHGITHVTFDIPFDIPS